MEYSKLISVTGLPGLFELVASKTDGAIVKSLDDKTTKFVSTRQHSFSHLESIEVYTVRDNVNLVDVFNAMGNNSEALPSEKDAAAIKAYFTKVFPDLDFDRVYASDMKKMVRWFGVLKSNGVEIKLREEEPVAEETTADTGTTDTAATAAPKEEHKQDVPTPPADKEEKPAKKPAKKKEPVAEDTEAETSQEPPKKKAAPKKKKAEE